MLSDTKKEFFTPVKTVLLFVGLVFLASWAHINFFLKDIRPFMDHEWYYFSAGYNSVIVFLYEMSVGVLNSVFGMETLNFVFVYKTVNVFYLIVFLVFVYLSSAFLYGRGFGLFAVFFALTSPELFNIFHKIEVNFQTASFLSILLYFYIRSNFGRDRLFSFLLVACGYVFFIQHYSSLLYLGPVIFVFLVFVCGKVRKSNNIKSNLFYSWLFFCFLFASDISIRPMRYYLYFDEFVKYFNMYFFVDNKFFINNIMQFGSIFKSNLVMIYNSKLLCFDFYFIFSFIVVVFHLFFISYRLFRKESLSFANQIEFGLIIVVFICVLFLGTGICLVPVFFAPLYVFFALLNASALSKLYFRSAKSFGSDMFFILICASVFLYGFVFLFFPNKLVGTVNKEYDCYVPLMDDFNMQEHMDYLKGEGVSSGNISVYPANVGLRNFSGLYAFSLSMGLDGGYGGGGHSAAEYKLGVYALKADDPRRIVSLAAIETDIFHTIVSKSGESNLSLVKIISYGSQTDDEIIYNSVEKLLKKYSSIKLEVEGAFVSGRRSLVFIYKVVK